VGRAYVGIANLRPLVCTTFISEMIRGGLKRRGLRKEDFPLSHDGRNKDLRIWFTQLECITSRRNQVRFVRRRSKWRNMK
jgi:hypothetical protein